MIVLYDDYPGISINEPGVRSTIGRVLGTFINKRFRVESITPEGLAQITEGVLQDIKANTLVLETENGNQEIYMGSGDRESRVARVAVYDPYHGCEEALYYKSLVVSKKFDELIS